MACPQAAVPVCPERKLFRAAHAHGGVGGTPPYGLPESFIVNYQEGRAAYGKSPDRFGGEQRQ